MIEIKDLYAGYGKADVLQNVSIGFEKGELTSVIGVNGCGKSTLLKAALGLLSHTRGEILIDEKKLSELKRNEIAKRIAYLAQGKSVPDMTVGQMVLHGRFPYLSYPRRYSDLDLKIASDAMKQVGIGEMSDMPVSCLSGGMRQNAYIAMALAQSTDYILLDEPTTYLDISHQIELIKTLHRLTAQGKGIIAVMHDLPLAFTFSDKIVVLDGGKLAIKGTPKEICDSDIVKKLFGISLTLTENGSYCYENIC